MSIVVSEADRVAAECPFCGEALRYQEDPEPAWLHSGSVADAFEGGCMFAGVVVFPDRARQWNRRATLSAPAEPGAALSDGVERVRTIFSRHVQAFDSFKDGRAATITFTAGGWRTILAALSASSPSVAGEERIAELETKLRMIVSHATGGGTDDITLSTNDISVRITQHRNRIYQAGKDAALTTTATASVEVGQGDREPFLNDDGDPIPTNELITFIAIELDTTWRRGLAYLLGMDEQDFVAKIGEWLKAYPGDRTYPDFSTPTGEDGHG